MLISFSCNRRRVGQDFSWPTGLRSEAVRPVLSAPNAVHPHPAVLLIHDVLRHVTTLDAEELVDRVRDAVRDLRRPTALFVVKFEDRNLLRRPLEIEQCAVTLSRVLEVHHERFSKLGLHHLSPFFFETYFFAQ